jgi:hypothetical protein
MISGMETASSRLCTALVTGEFSYAFVASISVADVKLAPGMDSMVTTCLDGRMIRFRRLWMRSQVENVRMRTAVC